MSATCSQRHRRSSTIPCSECGWVHPNPGEAYMRESLFVGDTDSMGGAFFIIGDQDRMALRAAVANCWEELSDESFGKLVDVVEKVVACEIDRKTKS